MNEEEKGIEIPCDSCGRLLHVSPGENGLTTNYKEYEEEKIRDYADIIIGSSANRFVLNMPGIVCNGDCSLELLDTVPDPPGLVCVVEITPAKADSAMMEMQFVKGTEAAVDFFLQLFPTSADVMDIAAIRLYQEGDKKRAYGILEHGIKHSDDADKLRMELAAFSGMDNDPHTGLEIMRDVSPDAIRYHVVKGNLFRAADQWVEAADCWKMAIETDPSDEIAWFNLGYFLLSVEERFLDAAQHYQAACDAFPEERRFRAYLGDSLFFQGRKTEALKEYHRALPMQGGDSQFEDSLRSMIDQCEGGMSLAKDSDVEKIEACKQAVKTNPDDAEAHYKLGIAYGESGMHEEEIEAYKHVISINPDIAEAHSNLGIAYIDLGMHKEAIEACKQAIRVNPDYAEAHFNLGVVYTDLGMHKEAIEVFKQAISINHDYADFAIMYRLLHSSRMPVKYDAGDDSLIENFHQDSLDSGSRIREGLSEAIEKSIISLAGGFLKHPANDQLRERIVASNAEGTGEEGIDTEQFYQFQLRLVYRLLFLIVVEERNLIYPDTVPGEIRETYYKYYSVNRIRYLSEKRYLMNRKYDDLWTSLKNTFILFENEDKGKALELKPLAGELFVYSAIGILNECSLDNQVLLECFRNLSLFTNKNTGQKMRVNYASLNVGEFGSVYEGLLEYRPEIRKTNGTYEFFLVKGSERSSSGSHYTPDELVQPLIKHSLDYIIEDKLKESDKEKALLSIKVCDVACGSGHILLNAARRIGAELARIRTGEDQPSPAAIRQGVRDAIQYCVYGVDKNPLAVELCKVALWLEAHNPGKPLNFLDHHIKCGDAIVGLANKDELALGIPNEAFKRLPDDDKDIAALLSKQNKEERKESKRQKTFSLDSSVNEELNDISDNYDRFHRLSEDTKEKREQKQEEYKNLLASKKLENLKVLADIPVAQFFIPKTKENGKSIITEAEYRSFLNGLKPLQGVKVAKAMAVAKEKRFFHWFLEFPDVFKDEGFDCILGNPPYLGGTKITSHNGKRYFEYLRTEYYPAAGRCDLAGYFVRRISFIIKQEGFLSLITTNTISEGDTREGCLDHLLSNGFSINHAVKSMKWPGKAAVVVALVTIAKRAWKGKFVLAGKEVKIITPYLDDAETLGNPYRLCQNANKSFIGSCVLGMGFVLKPDEAQALIAKDPKNRDVLFPYLNGEDLNNNPDQGPSRWVIQFDEMTNEKAREYKDVWKIAENKIYIERKGKDEKKYPRMVLEWWKHWNNRQELYKAISNLKHCFVQCRVSKTHALGLLDRNFIFSDATVVFSDDTFSFFVLLSSSYHDRWAWMYSSRMKSDRRYSTTDAFQTFPFPQNLSPVQEQQLEVMGETYYEHRKQWMLRMQLGLTKTYNLFHSHAITANRVDNKDKTVQHLVKHLDRDTNTISLEEAVAGIIKLRELHVKIDNVILEAYGWQDVALNHDFYEVDYLPENDRIRYTFSPEVRKEILKRLLELNHKIHEQEEKDGLLGKTKKGSKAKRKNDFPGQSIFQLNSIDK